MGEIVKRDGELVAVVVEPGEAPLTEAPKRPKIVVCHRHHDYPVDADDGEVANT